MIYTDHWMNENIQNIQIKNINLNDFVRLKNAHESFWVVVRAIDKKIFVGQVDNHLVRKSEYNYGDFVFFSKKDVCEHKTVQEDLSPLIKKINQAMDELVGEHGQTYVDTLSEDKLLTLIDHKISGIY